MVAHQVLCSCIPAAVQRPHVHGGVVVAGHNLRGVCGAPGHASDLPCVALQHLRRLLRLCHLQ